jgi:uncharacterized SAM-dependent methyltransferase
MDLFIGVAEQLGARTDREIAELAGVSVENVANWRNGAVHEFKPQKLKGIKDSIAARIAALREGARKGEGDLSLGLSAIEIEQGSSPADLQKQFRDRVAYDYLGHRFLYFDAQGALAWENLLRGGYEQELWISGAEGCAEAWLDAKKDDSGHAKGPIAEALGLGKKTHTAGLDIISLGPGEGGKELLFLRKLLAIEDAIDQRLPWITFAPIDVSIPLLLAAAHGSRKLFAEAAQRRDHPYFNTLAFCADFEEGPLSFLHRLQTSAGGVAPGLRLIIMLGNTFGNLRDEEMFVRQKLWQMARPGDLVWFEIGLRIDPVENDPLYRFTLSDREETSAEANRRLLLEGPFRRFEAASGKKPSSLDMRVWIREDDESSRIPGSLNFCHDLVMREERRVCTMLYSRRYRLEDLTAWLEKMRFEVLRIVRVDDAKKRPRVCHLLLRRTGA